MKCPKCNKELRKVKVKIQDADRLATSYQCKNCDYFDFEENSVNKVIEELKAKEAPLTIKQKIIKLSYDRLGMYFNKDVVRSLKLKPGEEVKVSVPDKNHIVIGLKD